MFYTTLFRIKSITTWPSKINGKIFFYIKFLKYPHLKSVFRLHVNYLELSTCPHKNTYFKTKIPPKQREFPALNKYFSEKIKCQIVCCYILKCPGVPQNATKTQKFEGQKRGEDKWTKIIQKIYSQKGRQGRGQG